MRPQIEEGDPIRGSSAGRHFDNVLVIRDIRECNSQLGKVVKFQGDDGMIFTGSPNEINFQDPLVPAHCATSGSALTSLRTRLRKMRRRGIYCLRTSPEGHTDRSGRASGSTNFQQSKVIFRGPRSIQICQRNPQLTQNTVDARYHCVAEADSDHYADDDFVSIELSGRLGCHRFCLKKARWPPFIFPRYAVSEGGWLIFGGSSTPDE